MLSDGYEVVLGRDGRPYKTNEFFDSNCSLSSEAEIFKRLDAVAARQNKEREERLRENKN